MVAVYVLKTNCCGTSSVVLVGSTAVFKNAEDD